jgi:hypothetical protein
MNRSSTILFRGRNAAVPPWEGPDGVGKGKPPLAPGTTHHCAEVARDSGLSVQYFERAAKVNT